MAAADAGRTGCVRGALPRPQPMPLAAPSTRRDLPLVDGLRLLASFAVVFHHMRSGSLFGVHFGVPLFLVILTALPVGSGKGEAPGAFAARKARSLLVPWVRWSLFYVGLAIAAAAASGEPAWSRLEPQMWIAGGHLSLWFLPFASVMLALFAPLRALAGRLSPPRAALVVGAAAVATTVLVDGWVERPLRDFPERLWLTMAPALLFGLGLGQSQRETRRRHRNGICAGLALAALVPLALTGMPQGPGDPALRFAVAVPLAALGFGLSVPLPRAVRWAAGTTFGVYLVHPLVAKVLATAADPFAWPVGVHALSVWGLACLAVAGLRHSPLAWSELWAGRGPRARRGGAQPRRQVARAGEVA